MRRALASVLVVSSALVCACGGSGHGAPRGAAVFAQDCRACHSLVGNESQRKQGGDLLGYRLTRQDLVQFSAEMPTPHRLSDSQLAAVVDYVLRAQQQAARVQPQTFSYGSSGTN